MSLSYTYLSTYPDGVWLTIQSIDIIYFRYYKYSFDWWKTIDGINYFPLAQSNKINVHYNGVCYPACTLRMQSLWKNFKPQMDFYHFPFLSNPISFYFHSLMSLGWMTLRSEGVFIISCNGGGLFSISL